MILLLHINFKTLGTIFEMAKIMKNHYKFLLHRVTNRATVVHSVKSTTIGQCQDEVQFLSGINAITKRKSNFSSSQLNIKLYRV